MSFLARWFARTDRPRVGLRPHRDVELTAGYDAAFDRVLQAIELALGAHIAIDDRRGGTIEAAFGLVNNERVRCCLHRIDDTHTAVRVEAFFPAGARVRERSPAVEALADMLEAAGSV
ncbi:MAG: hypothetical protein ABI231_12155 [Candidatus Tumulicola sp.]